MNKKQKPVASAKSKRSVRNATGKKKAESTKGKGWAGKATDQWFVQIGPQNTCVVSGTINGQQSANFAVLPEPGVSTSPTYAQYSTDGGGTWQSLPNDQLV